MPRQQKRKGEDVVNNFGPKSSATAASVVDLGQEGQKVEESKLEVYEEFITTMGLGNQSTSTVQDNNNGQQSGKRMGIFKEGESSKKLKIEMEMDNLKVEEKMELDWSVIEGGANVVGGCSSGGAIETDSSISFANPADASALKANIKLESNQEIKIEREFGPEPTQKYCYKTVRQQQQFHTMSRMFFERYPEQRKNYKLLVGTESSSSENEDD